MSLVLPCYNEEEGVRCVIESLPRGIDEIIVVDNNCTDRTAEVARSLGAKVVAQPIPGYGAAYMAGLAAASQEVVVTMDADGTYPTEAIEPLVEALEQETLDFISGCRFPLSNREAMAPMNQVGNAILTIAAGVLFFRPIRDSQSGMWIIRRAILPKLTLRSTGMAFSEEIKIEAIRRPGIRFVERHIHYHPRIGAVKLLMWRDGFQNLLYLIRLRFRP